MHALVIIATFLVPGVSAQSTATPSSSSSSSSSFPSSSSAPFTTSSASSTSTTPSPTPSSSPPSPPSTTITNNPSSSSPQVNYGNLIVLTVVLVIYLGVYCSKPLFRVWLKLARLVTSAGTVRTTQRELALQAASPRMLDPIRRGHGGAAGRGAGVDAEGRVMVIRDPELGVVVVEGGETLPRYASLGGGIAAAAAVAEAEGQTPLPAQQGQGSEEEVDLDAAAAPGQEEEHVEGTPPPSWAQHAEHAPGPIPSGGDVQSGPASSSQLGRRPRADSGASSSGASSVSVSAPLTGDVASLAPSLESLGGSRQASLDHAVAAAGQTDDEPDGSVDGNPPLVASVNSVQQ